MNERPRRRRSTLAAGILTGLILYAVSSIIIDQISFDHGPDDVRRSLRVDGGVDNKNKPAPRVLESRGVGPTLKGLHGQVYNFDKENFLIGEEVTWFNALSSPKVQWNIAPSRWERCPDGGKMYLGQTGFSFHEAAPDSPGATQAPSKYLKFRIQRLDSRECLFNYSKACLAGGSFIMNFGKTAKDMLRPGDYSLKTATGKIRIVAFNTGRACSMETSPSITDAPVHSLEETSPLDYLRDSASSAVDEEGCRAWIKDREAKDDLFTFNSDHATVHVDTPWMKIVLQVRQNKVTTEETCVYAGMDVWITNLSTGVLEDEFGGILGERLSLGLQPSTGPASVRNPMVKSRVLNTKEPVQLVVDGPFSK